MLFVMLLDTLLHVVFYCYELYASLYASFCVFCCTKRNTVTHQIVILQQNQKKLSYVPYGAVKISVFVTSMLVPIYCYKLPNSYHSYHVSVLSVVVPKS